MPFSAVIGQSVAVSFLKRTLTAGKLGHAYIFEGIPGCGKRTTALALVEALFCGGTEGCGNCPSCRKLASLQHPDLHLVEPERAVIKIDQIRELQRELALRPYEAPRKACIIADADRLNLASGNALLKTLEEPPGDALLILITANLGGVLPTIISRCQRLRFQPLTEQAIEERLVELGKEPGLARVASSMAGGSLTKALEACTEETLARRGTLLEQLTALSLDDIASLLKTAESLAADKEAAMEALDVIVTFLRDLLIYQSGGDSIVNRDQLSLIERQALGLSRQEITERLERTLATRQALLRNVNTRLALEVLFMNFAGEHPA